MDSITSRSDLNAIKSRLGSIAPSRFHSLPMSVQKLLSDDMPALIEEIEADRFLKAQSLKELDGGDK